MAFDLLVRGIDKVVGDGTLTEDDAMVVSSRKGAIVACLDAGAETPSMHLSGKQVPPRWIVVRTDLPQAEAEQYCVAWMPDIEITRESLSVGADRWRYTVRSRLVRASDNHGGMNQGKTKGFMEAWSFINITYQANRTRGRNTVFGLITSRGFWKQLAQSIFTELSYDQDTGQHVIRMDYSAVRPNKDEETKTLIDDLEVTTFIAQDAAANTIDFSVMRDEVLADFEQNVITRLENKIATRRWLMDPTEVDRIAVASGYEVMTADDVRLHMTDITA